MKLSSSVSILALGALALFSQSSVAAGNFGVPANGGFASGVGLFSGWNCDAGKIEIELLNGSNINGETLFEAAYGTYRRDTQEVCGDTNNAFGMLVNFNNLGDGEHTARALADGVEFGRTTFTVKTFDEPYKTGLSGTYVLENFPETGSNTTVQWQQSTQNFTIVGTTGGAHPGEFYMPGNYTYSIGSSAICTGDTETGTLQAVMEGSSITLSAYTDNALELDCSRSGPKNYPTCTITTDDGWHTEAEIEALGATCNDPVYQIVFSDITVTSADELTVSGDYFGLPFQGSIVRQ